MKSRRYRDASDLAAMQAFNAGAVAEAGWAGYIHVGDIPHRLFNGLRRHDSADVVRIWEDESGIAGWAMVFPKNGWMNVQVRPGLMGTELEGTVFAWAEGRIAETAGPEGGKAEADVWKGDDARVSLLTARGWSDAGDPYFVTMRPLADIPDLRLPDGYGVRSATGPDEADALAAVHAAGFGSEWTGTTYRTLMSTPGYSADRELVVEAPNGALAGFCVYWLDARNRVGLFEPLATHPDYRRLGVGSALLAAGMGRMRAAGMDSAMVVYQGENLASEALYLGNGFERIYELRSWVKQLR